MVVKIAAILLAAGGGSRMGANKPLTEIDGRPMVVIAAEAALAAGLAPVVVVTGFEAELVEAALPEGVVAVRNPAWTQGMAGSLATGIGALPPEIDGAAILLADMPRIGAAQLRRLAAAFRPGAIVVPIHGGRPGNPKLFARAFFPEILAIRGDQGAKAVVAAHADRVVEVGMDESIFADVDTPEDVARFSKSPSPASGRGCRASARRVRVRASARLTTLDSDVDAEVKGQPPSPSPPSAGPLPLPRAWAREFPALTSGFHPLDNAAMAQMPGLVSEAMAAFDTGGRGNVRRGLHGAARRADDAFDAARATIARFLGAAPGEVIITAGGTAALNLAAGALGPGLEMGDEVVLSQLDHHANLLPWLALAKQKGLSVKWLPVTADGRLDLEALPGVIGPRTRVVAVTMASNVTGAVTDLPRVAAVAHRVGAVVVADAAQWAPHGPFDAAASGADLLAFSGHKCFGPTGIGVLWGRRALLDRLPPVTLGGGMVAEIEGDDFTILPPPARFEAGTPPLTQAIGLAAALDWMMGLDWPALHARQRALTARLRDGLARRGARVIGPSDLGIVAFTLAGCHPHDIAQVLADRGVAVRAGHHCALPLAAALGLAEGTTRASLAPYTDEADIDALLAGLDDAIKVLR